MLLMRSQVALALVDVCGGRGLIVVPTLRVDLLLVSGITCAGIARVSLTCVLYTCRGGTHCFFGVDFPLVSGVLLASLHLLRVWTGLTLLKILTFVVFLLPAGNSLRIPGLLPKILLMACWNRR